MIVATVGTDEFSGVLPDYENEQIIVMTKHPLSQELLNLLEKKSVQVLSAMKMRLRPVRVRNRLRRPRLNEDPLRRRTGNIVPRSTSILRYWIGPCPKLLQNIRTIYTDKRCLP